MRGEIEQTPPPVSAKKINGVPAYKLARKNIPVDLAPSRVSIYELTLLGVGRASARGCAFAARPEHMSGRIAHQLGISLGCGAHIEALVRTQSGPFRLEQAFTLERLQTLKDEGRLEEALVPMSDLLPGVSRRFSWTTLPRRNIRQGRDFNVSAFRVEPGIAARESDRPGWTAGGDRAHRHAAHVYHPVVVLASGYDT